MMTCLVQQRKKPGPSERELWSIERPTRDGARDAIRVLSVGARLDVLLKVGDVGSEVLKQLESFVGDGARPAAQALARAGLLSHDKTPHNPAARFFLTAAGRRAYLAARALVR